MEITCHSEYLKLKSVFLKDVKTAFVSDIQISAQWKALNYLSRPDFDMAKQEYEHFLEALTTTGAEILYFSKEQQLSIDAIYCRDASIATDFGMIICNMGKGARKLEPMAQKKAFLENKVDILGEIMAPGTLEGGDVAWIDKKTLAVGHTYRTNPEGIKQLKDLLEPEGITVVEVQLPHFRGPSDVFHLMSIFSPVDKDLAVVYSPLMPIGFRNYLIGRGYELVEVPEEEFDSMGCNVLALDARKCLMVEGSPKTKMALIAAGCKVDTYKGHHISIKGGGGPTCLTRPMLRGRG